MLASLHARVNTIKSTKPYGVSQSVSELLTREFNMSGLGSDKNKSVKTLMTSG